MQTPKDRTITKSLADAEELLQQSQGHFNPDQLFFARAGNKPSRLADYIGPIRLANIPGTAMLLEKMKVCAMRRFNHAVKHG